MKRCWDWEVRLTTYINETQPRPFAYGQQDCVLWALGAVDAMCATALAAPFVGKYDSLETAAAVLGAEGWTSVALAAAALLGPPLPSPLHAQRGDVLVLPPAGPDALGTALIVGDTCFWGPTTDGVRSFPSRLLYRLIGPQAFKVGR